LLVAALVAAPAADAASSLGTYVALGDSYTSGPLIPNQHGDPIDCGRSDHNYPSFVANALQPKNFVDVSCGSAETKDMTAPQTGLPAGGTNPPQFNALTKSTDLVTIGIGGNDAGLVGVGEECGALDIQSGGMGTPCQEHYTTGGKDQIAEKIEAARPKVAAVLKGIHDRSPHARVAIAGYPHVTPPNGESCFPVVPLTAGDLHYFDLLLIRINKMIEDEAIANDAEYIDTYKDSGGHDVCKLPPVRWFEGLVPTMPAYPLHPNQLGEESMGRSALAVLSHPAPKPVLTKLRIHRHLRAGHAARVSFRLDRIATVTLELRRRHGHRLGRSVATTSVAGVAGRNTVKLRARLLRRRPGAYRLVATPATHAATGTARRAALRIRRH